MWIPKHPSAPIRKGWGAGVSAGSDPLTGTHLREAQRALIGKFRNEGFPADWVNRNAVDLLAQASLEYSEWLESHEPEENPVGWLITCAYRRGLNLLTSQGQRPDSISIDDAFDLSDESTPTPAAADAAALSGHRLGEVARRLNPLGNLASVATAGGGRALAVCGATAVAAICAVAANTALRGPSAEGPSAESPPGRNNRSAPTRSPAERAAPRPPHEQLTSRPRKSRIRRPGLREGEPRYREGDRDRAEDVTVRQATSRAVEEEHGLEAGSGSSTPPTSQPPAEEPAPPAPPARTAPPASGAAVESEFGL